MKKLRGFFRRVGLWFGEIPKPLRIVLLAVIVIILLVAAVSAYQVYDFVQNDPSFCRSCHTMEEAWVKWSVSAHKDVTCHTCHESNLLDSMEQVVKYFAQHPDKVTKHAVVPNDACESCHKNRESGVAKQIIDTPQHELHVTQQRLACTKCHSVSIHEFRASEGTCVTCHAEYKEGPKAVKTAGMTRFSCQQCHDFTRKGDGLGPTREECLSCHQDLPKLGLHQVSAHGSQACQACHKPHEAAVASRETCLTCHQNKIDHNPGIVCATCHTFRG